MVKPEEVMFVGDSFRDIQAAFRSKIKPVLVKTGNGNKALVKHQDELKSVLKVESLYELANMLQSDMAMGGLEPPTSAL